MACSRVKFAFMEEVVHFFGEDHKKLNSKQSEQILYFPVETANDT